MSLVLQQSDDFREDFALRALWYVRKAGAEIARRFQESVDATLRKLCLHPELGRIRHFQHPKLQGLRSFHIERPFHRSLIFYRVHEDALQAVRLIHGARDLPRKLVEPPDSE